MRKSKKKRIVSKKRGGNHYLLWGLLTANAVAVVEESNRISIDGLAIAILKRNQEGKPSGEDVGESEGGRGKSYGIHQLLQGSSFLDFEVNLSAILNSIAKVKRWRTPGSGRKRRQRGGTTKAGQQLCRRVFTRTANDPTRL